MAWSIGTSGWAMRRALWIIGCTTLKTARPNGFETTLSTALERKLMQLFSTLRLSIPERHAGVPGRGFELDAETEVYVLFVAGVGVEVVGGTAVELVELGG